MTIATKLKHAKKAFDVFSDVLFARCHKFMVGCFDKQLPINHFH